MISVLALTVGTYYEVMSKTNADIISHILLLCDNCLRLLLRPDE